MGEYESGNALAGETTYLSRTDDYGYPEYFISSDISEDNPLVLSHNQPIDEVYFNLIHINDISELDIEARFEDKDSTEVEKFSYRDSGRGRFAEDTRSVLPVRLTAENDAERVEISITINRSDDDQNSYYEYLKRFGERTQNEWSVPTDPHISLPALRDTRSSPPIFFISIDTFRHDYLYLFQDLIGSMGDDVFVPDNPRTQGYWTIPSHASTLTGTHPSVHGYLTSDYKIRDSVRTIPEMLANLGYINSSIVTQPTLGPDFGFAGGFHRFEERAMSWRKRDNDASTVLNRAREWMTDDLQNRNKSMFQFLHIFDPHFPYIPPESYRGDMDMNKENMDKLDRKTRNYIDAYYKNIEADGQALTFALSYYERSLQYVADQLESFIEHLKKKRIFDESFILISGDHGEDFFERGIGGHNSLYHTNIKPGMIVKPPAESEIEPIDDCDLIDFFPTVATLVNNDVPTQCQGDTWQSASSKSIRTTERFGSKGCYSISIEKSGVKYIFTYNIDEIGQPNDKQISSPDLVETYSMKSDEMEVGSDSMRFTESEALAEAELFLADREMGPTHRDGELDAELEDRLDYLGYK
jgi:hypothetical protein